MTIAYDEDDDETRPRILSNRQILGYIARHWLREPARFSAACALIVGAAACDLTIPWASRGLIAAVSSPKHLTALAWTAWATLSAIYMLQYASRSSTFRLLNGFYSRIMARMVNEGFRRVQSFSADWHADNFAGATVRRISRAMWGYDVGLRRAAADAGADADRAGRPRRSQIDAALAADRRASRRRWWPSSRSTTSRWRSTTSARPTSPRSRSIRASAARWPTPSRPIRR